MNISEIREAILKKVGPQWRQDELRLMGRDLLVGMVNVNEIQHGTGVMRYGDFVLMKLSGDSQTHELALTVYDSDKGFGHQFSIQDAHKFISLSR